MGNDIINIAIFASGNGTNAENIIKFFNDGHTNARVALVICNNSGAKVLERASRLGVTSLVIHRAGINSEPEMTAVLKKYDINFIVLAGFMLKVPEFLIKQFPDRIVNIHPALLPKYGGKGMYGHHVHEAVHANGETETGITIHYVNENYDDGAIFFQARTQLQPTESVDDIEAKIHELEQTHFPRVIQQMISLL